LALLIGEVSDMANGLDQPVTNTVEKPVDASAALHQDGIGGKDRALPPPAVKDNTANAASDKQLGLPTLDITHDSGKGAAEQVKTAKELGTEWHDAYIDKNKDFSQVNKDLADAVVDAYKKGGVEAINTLASEVNGAVPDAGVGPYINHFKGTFTIHNWEKLPPDEAAKVAQMSDQPAGIHYNPTAAGGGFFRDIGPAQEVKVALTAADEEKFSHALFGMH
jgi:hypothetical protein